MIMKNLKYLFLLAASLLFVACSGGEEEIPNDEKPDSPPQPEIIVENLPDGVKIGEETQQLNNIQLENIENVDEENSTLTLSSALPSDQIPKKGQIILQYSPTEELPYGFLGRVTNVKTNGGKIIVETEAPALDEAFEKLTIKYDMNNIQTMSRAGDDEGFSIDEDNYLCYKRSLEIEDLGVNCDLSLGVNISSDIVLDTKNNIDKQQYGFGIRAGAIITHEINLEGEKSGNHDFGNGIRVRLPYASPAIMGAIQFSWATEAKGMLQITNTITSSFEQVFYVYKDGSNIQTSESKVGDANMDIEYSPELILKGELFAGLGIRFDLRLFGRKELSVGIGSEIGPNAKAEIDLITNSENLYNELEDDFVTLQGLVKAKAYAQAKLFGFNNEWSKEIGDGLNFWETERYIFPEFKKSTLNISNGKAECSTSLGRDLLFKNEVGIGQYESDGQLIDKSTPIPYFLEKDFSDPIAKSFTHHDNNTYWTYVKWGEKIIKCKKLGQTIVGIWASPGYFKYISGANFYDAYICSLHQDGTFDEFTFTYWSKYYSNYGKYKYDQEKGLLLMYYRYDNYTIPEELKVIVVDENKLLWGDSGTGYFRINQEEYDAFVQHAKEIGESLL